MGVRRAQLVAMEEDVTDAFQFAGGHQRPAMEELPYCYGSQEGIRFVGGPMVAMAFGRSSSSNAGRGGPDTMGQEDFGLEGIGCHGGPAKCGARKAGCVTFNSAYRM